MTRITKRDFPTLGPICEDEPEVTYEFLSKLDDLMATVFRKGAEKGLEDTIEVLREHDEKSAVDILEGQG